MFSFALVGGCDQGEAPSRLVDSMMRAWPGEAPDGITAGCGGTGAAAAIARWMVISDDLRVSPGWDERNQTLIAGDVRLHNAADIVAALGLSRAPAVTDLELAGLAIARWGADAPRRLVGDFAFAVWNDRTRTLFAARDHFGLRPLYYCVDGPRTLVASDPRQLLPVVPASARAPCDEKIADYLSSGFCTLGRSYFEGIRLVKPGHHLTVRDGAVREARYWSFPPEPQAAPAYDESCAEVRELFTRAVVDRLASERPLVAHSSGGFDSSLILMVADGVYRREPARPPLVMASALTPGMASDDSPFMDALAARVTFEGVRWSALDPELGDLDSPMSAHPGLRRGPGGGPRGDLELARQRGARVLLSGFAGDEVTYSWEIFRDLARAHRWRSLLEQSLSVFDARRAARVVMSAMTGLLAPPRIEQLRAVKQRLRERRPRWLGPRLRPLWPLSEAPRQVATTSHLRWTVWQHITGAHIASIIDACTLYAANDGVEVRLPFADVRLVERILAIPWHQRLPNGRMRRLRCDALDPILPPEFARRSGQGSWSAAWVQSARAMLPRLHDLIGGRRWLSAPYVEQRPAREMLRRVTDMGDRADATLWFLVASFGTLEAWLRAVLR
jgi:asparagine synthase (glutamine-hydrolysing)